MDTRANAEGKYLKPDHVERSENKQALIVNEGQYIDTKFGKAFELTISFNKILKTWIVNQESNQNLADTWGYDSSKWVEHKIEFDVEKSKDGKKRIVAYAVGNDGRAIVKNKPIEDDEIVQ